MTKPTFLIVAGILLLSSCNNKSGETHPQISKNDRIAAVEVGLLPSLVLEGDSIKKFSLQQAMQDNKVPGVSIAVIENGNIDWAKGYGIAKNNPKIAVDAATLFQAASISKPISALAILQLMEEGKVHLDSNVNNYLKSWKVPENKFTKDEKVTLRRLLTHTAGTTVHGFAGYTPNDSLPSTQQVLEGKGNSALVTVDTVPGAHFKYSGGGYTIVQKVIEDLSGNSFEAYMDERILKPLGMEYSTFAQPLPEQYHQNASAAFDENGKTIVGVWHDYPEKAAAGLWTTPSDLARYIIAMQEIKAGKKGGLLTPATVTEMLSLGSFNHGLGPAVVEEDGAQLFVHGGFTNVFVAYTNEGKGLVVMTNADNGGALLKAIEKAVSNAYDWGLSEPIIIRPIPLSDDYLQQFEGVYTYVAQVPSVGGNYVVEVRIEKGELVIFDLPEDRDYRFVATDSLQFLNLDKGEKVAFKPSGTAHVLWWNDVFEFHKN